MAAYELRTYTFQTFQVGKLPEAMEIYKAEAWPALAYHGDKLLFAAPRGPHP